MIIDTSVLVAIALEEPDWESLSAKIDGASIKGVAAPSVVETFLVLSNRIIGFTLSDLRRILEVHRTSVIPFTDAHADLATSAYELFGKGRHPAKLNFGDCMAYATAKLADMPLLFKGTDFGLTDVRVA